MSDGISHSGLIEPAAVNDLRERFKKGLLIGTDGLKAVLQGKASLIIDVEGLLAARLGESIYQADITMIRSEADLLDWRRHLAEIGFTDPQLSDMVDMVAGCMENAWPASADATD